MRRSFKPQIDGATVDPETILGRPRPQAGPGAEVVLPRDLQARALEIAERHHPAWERCSDGARKMHARNIPQILGATLDHPSSLVVCWTEDGTAKGGTGQAIRVAQRLGVPIANLQREADRAALLKALRIADPEIARRQAIAMQAQIAR